MNWKFNYEVNGGCRLQLTETEARRIAEILKTKTAVLENRVQHYRGIHEVGEANDRQTTALYEAEQDFEVVKDFIDIIAHCPNARRTSRK